MTQGHSYRFGFEPLGQTQTTDTTRDVFAWYEENFKFVPNLIRVMAQAPALLRSYWQTQLNLQAHSSLSAPENNVVQMSIARENECRYCVSGHYLAGRVFFGSAEQLMDQIRDESQLKDAKLDALRRFALRVYETRGRVSEADVRDFFDAGYNRSQALDVVANIAAKVMSNLTNQLVNTELDEQFVPLAANLPF